MNFSDIYKRFRAPIFRYILRGVSDVEVAEELTQDVFIKVHRFAHLYDEKHALSTWLWTIAKHTLVDHLRSPRLEACEIEDIASLAPSVDFIMAQKEERRRLLNSTKHLTRSQKRVLWMYVVRELSYEEISAKLNLSVSSAKNLVYRAKKSLEAHITET